MNDIVIDQLPNALDAEQAALGSILENRDAMMVAANELRPEMFYVGKHKVIFAAMLDCHDRRVPPDVVNVAAVLRSRNQLEEIGGPAYLLQLVTSTPTSVHIEYYAQVIQEQYLLRQVIAVGEKIVQSAYKGGKKATELIADIEEKLRTIAQTRQEQDFVPIGDVVDLVFAEIQRAQESELSMVGLPTGYHDLDELTGGLQKSDLIIVAARPAVGKSSWALSLAYNVAYQYRAKVGFFALEMSKEQLIYRVLSMHTGFDTQKLRTGQLRDSDLNLLTDAMGVIAGLPIYVNDMMNLSVAGLRAKVLRLQAEHGLDLLIIDYLQLMQGKRTENRTQEVSDISRSLKSLARELNIPVVALSQLSRAVEGRQSHVPMLSDLRESGSIEQDSDMVLFIYREELYDPETDKKGIAELHIAKHRSGPVGMIPLRFFHNTTRFQTLERYRQPEGY